MDDEAAMGLDHRLAHAAEERHALAQRETAAIAELGDWETVDVLHDEVQMPTLTAGVEQLRDTGVVQGRQNATFLLESLDELVAVRARIYDLDGDVATEGAVGTVAEIHAPHAARTNQTHDLIRAEALSGQPIVRGRSRNSFDLLVYVHQPPHFVEERMVVAAGGLEILVARAGSELDRDMEQITNAIAWVGAHDLGWTVSRGCVTWQRPRRRV